MRAELIPHWLILFSCHIYKLIFGSKQILIFYFICHKFLNKYISIELFRRETISIERSPYQSRFTNLHFQTSSSISEEMAHKQPNIATYQSALNLVRRCKTRGHGYSWTNSRRRLGLSSRRPPRPGGRLPKCEKAGQVLRATEAEYRVSTPLAFGDWGGAAG